MQTKVGKERAVSIKDGFYEKVINDVWTKAKKNKNRQKLIRDQVERKLEYIQDKVPEKL